MLVLLDLTQELVLVDGRFLWGPIDRGNSDRAISLGHHETPCALFLIITLSVG